MATKLEKALLSTANRLTTDKLVVVAVYTESWNGLSFNPVNKFNEYLTKSDTPKDAFYQDLTQVKLVPNYNLRFPVRVESINALETLENYLIDLKDLQKKL